MTNKPLRQVTLVCLASTALLTLPAMSAQYTVSVPTLVKNGDPGNIVDGNDTLTITTSGSITTGATTAADASGSNNTITNWGSIVTTGFGYGMRIIDSSSAVNAGSIVTSANLADAIHATNSNTITNSGSIGTAGLNAWAVNFQNNNTLTNSGTISTTGNGGRAISGNDSNTILNTGTLTTTGNTAYGIEANNSNTVTNSGTISTGGSSSNGIYLDNNNTATNSGTIMTTGSNGNGIRVGSTNMLTNSGSILTSGSFAYGLIGTVSNTVLNSGSISTSGTGSNAIFVSNTNTISNTGSITTTGANAMGMVFLNNNTVSNSGSIETGGNTASGIYAAGTGNTITNSGTIQTTGDTADGIHLLSTGNTASNSGTIIVSGANAFGIAATGANNILNNSGSITTNGVGGAGMGAYPGGNNLTINNSGSILTNGEALGIVVLNDSTINNSGSILTKGTQGLGIAAITGNIVNNSGKVVSTQTDAFRFTGADNQLNLLAPAFIGGTIDMGTFNAVSITTGRSHSNLWTFGGNPASVSIAGPVPWAWDAATKQFATLDPTAFSAAPDMLADTTASLSGLARANTQENWWMQGYGNFTGYGAQGIFNDYASLNGAIAIGANFAPSNQFEVGVFAGYQRTLLNVNSRWVTSQTITGNNAIAGLTGSVQMDNMFADFALLAGFGVNSSDRFVNDNLQPLGEDHALASYDSFFIAPEVRVGVNVDTGGDWTLTPSASARFSNQWIAGYTETGSNANATVAARQVQVFEGGLELAATRDMDNGTLTLVGGAQYRQALGASTQNITLLGQTLALPLSTSGSLIGYVGADASFEIGDMSTFNIAAKASIGSNNSYGLSGSLGWNSEF